VLRYLKRNKKINKKKRQASPKARHVDWQKAPDINKKLSLLIDTLHIDWLKKSNIHAFRSYNSKARAYARIWGLNRVWQKALGEDPAYVIEVLSERFDKLSEAKQNEVLIHEICHIPKNFSGSLLPHIRKGNRRFEDRVHALVAKYKKSK